MHKHVWRKDPLTHMIHKLESAELAGWTNLCLSAVQLRQMLKKLFPSLSMCYPVKRNAESTHPPSVTRTHADTHTWYQGCWKNSGVT